MDQGEVNELGGPPRSCFIPGPPGLTSGLALPWAPWNSLLRGTFKEMNVANKNFKFLNVTKYVQWLAEPRGL